MSRFPEADGRYVWLSMWKSEPQMAEDVKSLPDFAWKVAPESMLLFLTTLKQEYGSTRQYIKVKGAELSLIHGLKRALLT